jgi:hypothetical protein
MKDPRIIEQSKGVLLEVTAILLCSLSQNQIQVNTPCCYKLTYNIRNLRKSNVYIQFNY